MEFDEKKMEEYIGGIVAENRDHPILKNKVKQCNQCRKRVNFTATCEKYPDRIPHKVLVNGDCPDFTPKGK